MYTIVDQQLKSYIENQSQIPKEQADAMLDQLMDRYNLTNENTDGFFDQALQEIWSAQTTADQALQAANDEAKIFEVDGVAYTCSTQREIKIGDTAYDPASGGIMGIDEENVHFANEEYYLVVAEEKLETFQVELCRIGYGYKTLTIQATSYDDACDRAFEQAGDHEYTEKSSEYKLANDF